MNFDIEDMRKFADRHRGKNYTSGPHWSTIARFALLFDEYEKLAEVNAEVVLDLENVKAYWINREREIANALDAATARAEAAEARAVAAEAENKRLRNGLKDIIFECGLHGMGEVNGLTITTMAQRFLKDGKK